MRGEGGICEGARKSEGPGLVHDVDEFCRGIRIHGRIGGRGGRRVKLVDSARSGDESRGIRGVSRRCGGGRARGAVLVGSGMRGLVERDRHGKPKGWVGVDGQEGACDGRLTGLGT